MTLDESVVCAVKYCLENDILKDFLREHGSEVIAMMVHEYTTEDFVEAMVEHAREEVFELMEQGMPIEKIKQYLKQKSTTRLGGSSDDGT